MRSIAEAQEWIKSATFEELCMSVIWESVMEGTAHCGWTDNARDGLVRSVQESVKWAINQKLTTPPHEESK